MQAIRRIFLASLFFLANASLAFWFYSGVHWAVRSLNRGTSSGYNPEGLFWSREYPRFIPWEYETAASIAFDLGLAALCVSGAFYGAMLIARRKKATAPVDTAPTTPAPAAGKRAEQSAQRRRRLLLIPAWLVFQYFKNLFSGMSGVGAIEAMTSIESLFFSDVVVAVVVLYANGYEVAFGSNAKQESKPATEVKK